VADEHVPGPKVQSSVAQLTSQTTHELADAPVVDKPEPTAQVVHT